MELAGQSDLHIVVNPSLQSVSRTRFSLQRISRLITHQSHNDLRTPRDQGYGLILMTYKALGRSITNYATPVWSINASDSNIGKIQHAQNEALRSITGSHKMSSIDHLRSKTEMLQVEDHLNLLSVQYLDTKNVCHHITKVDPLPRDMMDKSLPDTTKPCYHF